MVKKKAEKTIIEIETVTICERCGYLGDWENTVGYLRCPVCHQV